MPIQTTLLKLNINCKKHGDDFYKEPLCQTCVFLIHYNQQIKRLEVELAKLTSDLQERMKTNDVVVTEIGGKFCKESL
jgi:hypothetical protein